MLLSEAIYNKCIRRCGYNTDITRLMQVHQLYQISRTASVLHKRYIYIFHLYMGQGAD